MSRRVGSLRARSKEAADQASNGRESSGSRLRHASLPEGASATEERVLRTFVSETAFPMAMFDREMCYLAVSRAWLADYRLDGESVLGRSHYEVFPEISGDWKLVHREGLEGKSIRRDEDRFERDGTVQWLRWEVRPWKRSDDSIGGIVIISEDITQRKAAEEDLRRAKEALEERIAERASALAESEERFRLFMDHSPSVAWVKDEAGRLVYLNRTFELRFGVSLADWRGKTDAELWPPDVADAFRRNDLAVLEGDRSIEVVEQSPNPDGSLCSWLNVKFPFRDAAGRRFVAGVGLDVTARIQAEEALRSQAALLDMAHDAIMVRDVADKITFWNRGAEATYGWSRAEALGRVTHDLLRTRFPAPPADLMADVIEEGQWAGELRHTRKDGREIVVASRWAIQRDRTGASSGVLEINRDITERKQAEEALRDADRKKDEFLALLGHELRNPLAAISTALQVLPSVADEAGRSDLTQVMARQVGMMRRLMDDLLDVERITHGHIDLSREAVDLEEFLCAASAAMRPTIAERRQELLLGLPADPTVFMADRTRLDQIVNNLLSNASKYSPPGSRIELTGALEGSEIVIRCRDFGQGIPAENLERIFEPFTRGPRSELGYGEASLGIGLTLARRLAELHGGSLEAASEGLGSGSRFTIRLPRRHPRVEPVVAPKPPPAGRYRESRNIVVVEDNPTIAALMKTALQQAGKEVRVFSDGLSALSAMATLEPDTILLDIGLPGMDGYEVADRLRKYPQLADTRFIAISGFEARKPGARLAQVFDHYLLKPVNVAELLNLLDAWAGPAAVETPRSPREGSGPIRVLLVEDHASLAAVTARLLRREGLEVHVAGSGKGALEAASTFPQDILLCDLNLPDMSGLDVIRELKSACPAEIIRAVIVTGTDASEVASLRRNAAKLGVHEFVTKPLTVEAIRGIVARFEAGC